MPQFRVHSHGFASVKGDVLAGKAAQGVPGAAAKGALAATIAAVALSAAPVAQADFRLPPIDKGALCPSPCCSARLEEPSQPDTCAGKIAHHTFLALPLPPLPPLETEHEVADPNRCERGYVGNTIGQANAVSDRVLDLRKCEYKGANLAAKVLSGALMSEADFSKTNMRVRPPPPAFVPED